MKTEEWRDDAICLGNDINLFFTKQGQSPDEAKAICQSCPVREDCLEYAMEMKIEDGVWGGYNGGELYALRKGTYVPPDELEESGPAHPLLEAIPGDSTLRIYAHNPSGPLAHLTAPA